MLGKMMGAMGAFSMMVSPLTIGAVAATGAASLAAVPAHAASYWGCDAGFTFQTVPGGGRCFKAARIVTDPPLACPRLNTPAGPIGSALRIDNNGINDVCATNVGIVVTAEVACGLGYTIVRRTGADQCEKRVPAEERQPSRRFAV